MWRRGDDLPWWPRNPPGACPVLTSSPTVRMEVPNASSRHHMTGQGNCCRSRVDVQHTMLYCLLTTNGRRIQNMEHSNHSLDRSAVRGITAFGHIRKNDLMPLIICKNDKHLVTLYNVIFSNITGILSYLSYIFYLHKRAAVCHWNEMYWENYLSDQTNTQTVMSLKT